MKKKKIEFLKKKFIFLIKIFLKFFSNKCSKGTINQTYK